MPTDKSTNGPVSEIDTVVAQVVREVPTRVIDPVEVKLDNTLRHLRMDFRAMRVIQQKTGLIMWRGDAWDPDNLDPEKLATIIWACLLHEDPDLTLEEVESMPGMQLSNFNYITDRIGALWGFTMPRAEEGESESASEGTDPNLQNSPTG